MTVRQGLRRIIIKKSIILLCVASALGVFCYFSNNHKGLPNYYNAHFIYTLITIVLSVAIFLFIAYKMRFFHDLFAKEFTGTIVNIKREVIHTRRVLLEMDDIILFIRIDDSDKKKKLRLPGNKVGRNVYVTGDRVRRLKGTRYPINLTREVEQHICPICGFNSCYDDECPNCKVKY